MSWRFTEAAHGRYYDADGCPIDSDGRHQPHGLNMAVVMRHPGLQKIMGECFSRRVPEDRVEEDVQDDVYLAQVACTCGERPIVELSAVVECKCERFFYYAGAPGCHARRVVFVGNSPLDRDPQTSAAA